MGSTLSRQIRRLNVGPTTFREVTEKRLVKEDGEEVEREVKVKKPIRNTFNYSKESLEMMADDLRKTFRARRKRFRAAKQAARALAQSTRHTPAAQPVKAGKKK